ncbi:TraB/GumN family protein [Asticcacaulis sp. ZE23SCel15]|uniref:TraB/GumN family protein n=1 Tax=Asticcacaulis sp. ZE23SCel15 TaxID=3059027 RepID=UPI00265F5206|nr:TraB/GumN family protein [Asticcacaulis sp. ZE23SCel15]WKL57978.1 TraB/GumN family protein [Asticcacaulis sp. ZE23SCel15]
MLRIALILVLMVFVSLPVQAAVEDWNHTEVVVAAKRPPGPALWRIKKGEAEVVIVGVLPVFPKSQGWSTKRLENALRGAKVLITPPDAKTSAGDAVRVLRTKGLPGKQTLKDVLPPDLNARFEATAKRAGVSAKSFVRDKPVWAGARLRREVLEKRRLSADEPTDTIVRIARKQGVPVRPAGKYKTGPVLKDLNRLSDQDSQDCLRYTLGDIDFNMDRAPKAAAAWAVGDIRTVRANYQGGVMAACLEGSDVGTAMLERSVEDIVGAINSGLQTPGKTVVIVPLSPLLRKGGALDQLQARGLKISAPE